MAFRDVNGKEIAGYRFGTYWFQCGRRISGLSGGSFGSERELTEAYDSANGRDREDGPGLIRVYVDGSEQVLRVGDNNRKQEAS